MVKVVRQRHGRSTRTATSKSQCTSSMISAAIIKKTMQGIDKFAASGRAAGLDHLTQTGYDRLPRRSWPRYIGDWVLDDEPVTLKTTTKPHRRPAYSFELHDIVMMSLQSQPSEMFYRRIRDHFEWLYQESAERPKIMASPCTRIFPASPTASRMLQRTSRKFCRNGRRLLGRSRILDWYLGQRKA